MENYYSHSFFATGALDNTGLCLSDAVSVLSGMGHRSISLFK
jgi:hypothetical protein